jgi:hypothetical protein
MTLKYEALGHPSNEKVIDHFREITYTVAPEYRNEELVYNKVINEIKLNGQQFIISRVGYLGSEVCPIVDSLSDKEYQERYKEFSGNSFPGNSFPRDGNCNWLISNLDNGMKMWLLDLLPSQVAMFGFCQSPSSYFKLDLEKYIKVFNLDLVPKIEPIDIKNNNYIAYSPYSKEEITNKCKNVLEQVDTSIYNAFLIDDPQDLINEFNLNSGKSKYEGDKTCLCILFKDKEWVKENHNEQIEVLGKWILVRNSYGLDKYILYGNSEYMNHILFNLKVAENVKKIYDGMAGISYAN